MADAGAIFKEMAEVLQERARRGGAYHEFVRIPSMSVGVYVLGAGAVDTQSPHRQDELYYVLRGKAQMRADGQERPVRAGSVIFVAAGVEHRFYDIEEEITLLVLFAPAETE
jgi:mannose-6-phosphate isomerase-like protein (cupin superfamily)